MGKVYRAFDPMHGEEVALKVLTHMDAEQIFRIKQEFRGIREINHPNLVRFKELFVDEGNPFFTMELLQGQTLDHYLKIRAPKWETTDSLDIKGFQTLFLQFAEAINTVHQAGLLHRDIKPSNVFITKANRVVLLDFGLCRFQASELTLHGEGTWVGSFRYMAPESILGQAPAKPSDWYAFGIAMAEALLRNRLFAEDPIEIYQEKIRPFSLETLNPIRYLKIRGADSQAVEAIFALICRLLSFDPVRRPEYQEIVQILEGSAAITKLNFSDGNLDQKIFLGREAETHLFLDSCTKMLQNGPRMLGIHGPGGIGKTAFVEQACATFRQDTPSFFLKGKCNVYEAIPFKAMDPIIDGLSRILANLHPDARTLIFGRADSVNERLYPELLSIFPVLSQQSMEGMGFAKSPGTAKELLNRAGRQLGEIFSKLAVLRPVVLFIDDFQWGDVDSIHLIREMLSQKLNHRILFVTAYREKDFPPKLKEEFDFLVHHFSDYHTAIELPPLAISDLKLLSKHLLQAHSNDFERIQEMVIRESDGNPYIAVEVALQATSRPWSDFANRSASALQARMQGLSPEEARIVNYIAMAFAPLELSRILDLLGMPPAQRALLFDMCGKRLLRTLVHEQEIRVDIYHELLRNSVLKGITPQAKDAIHLDFIANYQTHIPLNHAVLFRHHLALKHRRLAGFHAFFAAKQAAAAYAFNDAVEYLKVALRLKPLNPQAWKIRKALAEPLHQAGNPGEAAVHFEAAADLCQAHGGTFSEWMGLLIEATSEYFIAGLWEKGRNAMLRAADHLGLRIPRSTQEAVRHATIARLGFLLGQIPIISKAEAPATEQEILQLKFYRGASWGLAMLDHKTSDALTLPFLKLAIRKGNASDVARAFALEASTEANIGISIPWLGSKLARRSEELLAKASAIAESTTQHDRAHILAHHSSASFFLGKWNACISHANASMTEFRSNEFGYDWGLVVAQAFLLAGLAMKGKILEMQKRAVEFWRDAEARDDLNAAVFLKGGEAVYVSIARDETDSHLKALNRLGSRLATDKFTSHHYSLLVGLVQLQLYRGEYAEAWQNIQKWWPRLKAELFLNLDGLGVQLRYLYGRTCLAMLNETNSGQATDLSIERGTLEIKKQIRALIKSKLPHSVPFRNVLEAGILKVQGHANQVKPKLVQAAAGFEECGMKLYAEAARWRATAENPEAVSHSLDSKSRALFASMVEEGIAKPERLAILLVPV